MTTFTSVGSKRSLWKRQAVRHYAWNLVEVVFILSLVSAVMLPDVAAINYQADEGFWLSNTYVLSPLVRGDFDSPDWVDSYTMLRHPMLTVYIVSLGQLAGGYDVTSFKPLTQHVYDPASNTAREITDIDLLWWSRLPAVILAILSGLLLFKLIQASAGRLAAYAGLALYAFNPWLLKFLRRAMGEAPQLFFVLLAVIAGAAALNAFNGRTEAAASSFKALVPALLWFTGMGVLIGLAAGIKFNAITAILSSFALAVIAVGCSPLSLGRRAAFVISAGGLSTAAAGLAFILPNPYLYPDVVGRIRTMVEDRLVFIEIQKGLFPETVIADLGTRVSTVPLEVLQEMMAPTFQGAWLVYGLLTAIGLWRLLGRSWRWYRTSSGSPTSIAILLVGLFGAAPMLLSPLNWKRYYLLPFIFVIICSATGLAWLLAIVARRIRQQAGPDGIQTAP